MTSASTSKPSLATREVVRDKDRPSAFFEAAKVSSVGLEMGVSIAIGWGIGYWLDKKFATDPWLMVVGLLFGVAAGFNGLLRASKQARRNAELDAMEKRAAEETQ